jgi:hypothetical protein
MATARPGPLVSTVSGRVGGIYFARRPGGMQVARCGRRVVTQTGMEITVRTMMGRVAAAWRGLSASDRNAWIDAVPHVPSRGRALGSRAYSGYALFCQAQLATMGTTLTLPISPPAPPYLKQTPNLVTEALDGALVCTGLEWALASGEWMVIRVGREYPNRLRQKSGRGMRWVTVPETCKLGPTPDRGMRLNYFPTCAYRAAATLGYASCQWSLWWYKRPMVGPQYYYLWNVPTKNTGLVYDTTAGLYLSDNATQRIFWPGPLANGWHFILIRFFTGTMTFDACVDGVFTALQPFTNVGWAGDLIIGAGDTSGFHAHNGNVDEFAYRQDQYSNAQVTAAYNGGYGAPLAAEARLRHYWKFDTLAAGLWADSGSTPESLTNSGGVLSFGKFGPVLYFSSESVYGASRLVPCKARLCHQTWPLYNTMEVAAPW